MRSGLHQYIGRVDVLRARCVVDDDTGCWNWRGATSSDGAPRIHTFDHRRGEKRTMSGPAAVWNIAHKVGPLPGWLVMRRCGNKLCACPGHHLQVQDRQEMGRKIAEFGFRKGTGLEARRACQKLAMAACGIVPTPDDVVLAVRAADRKITNRTLARQHGIAEQTVSRMRRGQSHRHLLEVVV